MYVFIAISSIMMFITLGVFFFQMPDMFPNRESTEELQTHIPNISLNDSQLYDDIFTMKNGLLSNFILKWF